VIDMTTDEEKKRELKMQQVALSRRLEMAQSRAIVVDIKAFDLLEDKAKRTKKEIRDLEKL